MKVSKEHIKTAVQVFVDRDLVSKGTTTQKFFTFMAANLVLGKIDNLWPSVTSNQAIAMFGLVDEHGHLEADEIIRSAREAMDKSGPINAAGIIFTKSDIDSFERYLQEVVAAS
jgi:hypothetical protein